MCVLCFNTKWRCIVIGIVSGLVSLSLFLITLATEPHISQTLLEKFSPTKDCEGNSCVYYAFSLFFPGPLWGILLSYSALNFALVGFSVYSWLLGITIYLALDAVYVGMIGTCLCLSFFPDGLVRITLLTFLFPSFSLSLCAWMSVFGLYLRLEDSFSKRSRAQKMLLDADPRKSEYVNLAFNQGDK